MLARLSTTLALVAGLLACMHPRCSQAAIPSPAPTPVASPKTLDALVVTAQRHAEKIRNTPRQTFVVWARDLERLGAVSAADALRYYPGILVQQYGSSGALATVALRGASSSETLVLIDGRPVNEADTGLFDFSSLPTSAIDRIEIVEGGSSTLYGSSAVGGVINVITKRPGAYRQTNAFAQLGYQGAFDRGLSVTLGNERQLAVQLSAQSSASHNVFDYPAFLKLEAAGTRSDEDATVKHTAVALVRLFGRTRGTLTLDDDASSLGAPGSVAFPSAFARQQRVYERMSFDVSAPLAQGEVALQAYSDSRRLRFFDPSFGFDSHANGTFRGVLLRLTQAAGKLHTLTAGWDGKGDSMSFDAGVPGQPPLPAHDASAAWYLQDEFHAPGSGFRTSAGLRDEHLAGTQATLTPSLGILAQLGADGGISANYARAFRAPSLDERYYPFYGNPSLAPEYSATFDVGARAERAAWVAGVAWFGSDTSNLIVNVPIDHFGDVAPFNVNRARIRGVEGNAQIMLRRQLRVSLTYTGFIQALDIRPGRPATRLQYRPSATGGIRLWLEQRSWDYGLQGAFVGKRFADEANTRLMPAYFLTSAYVTRSLSPATSLTLRVDNLENNHHAEDVLGYPIVGRALSVRLAVRRP